jgi:hypothetical protein
MEDDQFDAGHHKGDHSEKRNIWIEVQPATHSDEAEADHESSWTTTPGTCCHPEGADQR